MGHRGQGAMEMLMTYGWGILAILVIGVVLYQMGVINFGGESATTYSGFTSIKPLVIHCAMQQGVGGGADRGFICQFSNQVGKPIRLTDITITVNGKYCGHTMMSTGLDNLKFISYDYADSDGTVASTGCTSCTDLEVQAGDPFRTISYSVEGEGSMSGYCLGITAGEVSDVFVDIAYDINVGGVTANRHSQGAVHTIAT